MGREAKSVERERFWHFWSSPTHQGEKEEKNFSWHMHRGICLSAHVEQNKFPLATRHNINGLKSRLNAFHMLPFGSLSSRTAAPSGITAIQKVILHALKLSATRHFVPTGLTALKINSERLSDKVARKRTVASNEISSCKCLSPATVLVELITHTANDVAGKRFYHHAIDPRISSFS